EEGLELLLERRRVAARVAHDLGRLLVEEERIEEVLDRDELVAAPGGLTGGEGERDLDFGAHAHGFITPARPSGAAACLALSHRSGPARSSSRPRPSCKGPRSRGLCDAR